MPAAKPRVTPWWKRTRKPRNSLDGQGREQLDPNPLTVKGPGDAPLSVQDQIKAALRSERLNMARAAQGVETFEEADDFDIEDEEDWRPFAPWEEDFEVPAEFDSPPDNGEEATTAEADTGIESDTVDSDPPGLSDTEKQMGETGNSGSHREAKGSNQ